MTGSLALLVVTAVVAALVAALVFAVLRFLAATRSAQRRVSGAGSENVFLSSALQDAVGKLKAQEQLMRARAHESEAFSEHIVDSLASGLLVVDLDGRVQILNPAGRRLLGVDADTIGRDVHEVLHACRPLRDEIALGMTCQAATAPLEVAFERADARVHLSVSVSPIASVGAAKGIICLFTDVTPLRELEEQLRLKDALARLGELTAGIAHEFRNGLATIHGYSRLLRPESLPETCRPYVDGIRQEAESLGHVMTNFLKYARPDQMALAPVDLGLLARRAAAELRTELPPRTDVQVDGDFAPIVGDDVLLRQVFGNLIRNGAEACATAHVHTPMIHVRGTIDGRVCRVAVDDNGPGIPDESRSRVFEPFFTTRSRGTGLGLAIVQKVVVTHNGRVQAGRSPLGGASILMTFPLADSPRNSVNAAP